MEVSSASGLKNGEERALKGLLEAFGTVFSLNDIAIAFCKAGKNPNLAGQILYEMGGSSTSSTAYTSDSEARNEESTEPSEDNKSNDSWPRNEKFRGSKQKCRPASVGSVSSILGKEYVRSIPLANGSCPGTKPLKLDAKDLPVPELVEDAEFNPSNEDLLRKDMEKFLFKMFEYQLDRDVISEVFENCAYDIEKSMEKLLDMSMSPPDSIKKKNAPAESSKKIMDLHPSLEGSSQMHNLKPVTTAEGDVVSNANGGESPRQQRMANLQKEVLASLFADPERVEELPRRKVKLSTRSLALGKPVVGPIEDSYIEPKKTDRVNSRQDNMNDEDKEGSFEALRKAVREYRGTMKEYYKEAVDAFAKGDHIRANKFLEQGVFFRDKAREADDESNKKIFETRDSETQDEMLLDLHTFEARGARSLLKSHLSSLAGIPTWKFLKVILETDEEDTSKGARRRLVTKLLEKESISWTEGGPGSILIRLDKIIRSKLSFVKKY